MSRELVFIHVHIPKCGGSTFQDILKRNVSTPKAYYREAPIVMQQHKSIDIELMIQRASYVEIFSSHHVTLDLPFKLRDPKIIAITHVRNPVDRFVSHFFYEKRQANKSGALHFDSKFKNMTFDQYIDYCLENKNEYMHIKDQVGWLTGKSNESGLKRVNDLVNSNQLFLFPLDRFDESCVILEKLFPEYFNNCAYIKLNVAQKNNELSEKTTSKIKQIVNPLDVRLIKMAENQLNELIKCEFSGNDSLKAELDNFYLKCNKFRTDLIKMRKKQKILGKINKVSRYFLGLK